MELDLAEDHHLALAAACVHHGRASEAAEEEVHAVLESVGLEISDEGAVVQGASARRCRICGCTDYTACDTAPFGDPCHWVADDVCSGCAPDVTVGVDSALGPDFSVGPDWVTRMAVLEGDCEIGAGSPTHPLRTDAAVEDLLDAERPIPPEVERAWLRILGVSDAT